MSAILSPRMRYRYLPRIAIALGVVGVIALIIFLLGRASSNNPNAQLGKATGPTQGVQKKHATVTIEPAARRVMKQFITMAVERQNLAKAWALVAPGSDVRNGITHSEWLANQIPVVPQPRGSSARFNTVHSWKNDILLEVLMQPPAGTGQRSHVFFLQTHKYGDRWLVTYWAPEPVYGVPSSSP
jgi:hypothetical protein